MSFWSNPVQSTEQAISGLGKDISNIPNDVSSFVSNPKQATANLMANPFMPALIVMIIVKIMPPYHGRQRSFIRPLFYAVIVVPS